MQALFTLTPSESKRLIGKGMAALPEVQNAKKNGYLLVSRGSTTAYCLEELLGQKSRKGALCRGRPDDQRRTLRQSRPRTASSPYTFHKGEMLPVEPEHGRQTSSAPGTSS